MSTPKINELNVAINNKKEEISALRKEIDNFEIELSDDDYDLLLDESYEEVELGGCTYSASTIIKNCDQVAYRTGKNDYVDSLDKSDDLDYRELESKLEELEDELTDLEDELSELENDEDDYQSTPEDFY